MTVYVSTSCLKNPQNILKVLKEYESSSIENVELGSVHSHFNLKELKKFHFNYLVHNYFPPPKTAFNFNLASQNKSLRNKSIKLAKTAINLCREINAPLYTFHAGFTVDPHKLGKPFDRNKIIERKTAIEIFCDSLFTIIDHANTTGIKLAMEPNVVQQFNLINGKNELLLFADYPEIKQLYKTVRKNDVGLLLDLGHTAVTSYWLHFDKDDFVKSCKDKVSAIHVSNNDGRHDQHKSLTKTCWQLSKLSLFKKLPIILETMNLSIVDIKKNITLVNDYIN